MCMLSNGRTLDCDSSACEEVISMAYIYKIINDVNDKIYIGKTLETIDRRWKEHCRSYNRERCEKRPLYNAINKYGIENFHMEQIEECSNELSSEREIYWINYYNSYKEGYNATLGGDGKTSIDYNVVVDLYLKLQNCSKVAKELGISPDTISKILRSKNIEVKTSQEVTIEEKGKNIKMLSLEKELLQTFSTMSDGAMYLIQNDISKATKNSTRNKISEVCSHKRKTAYGYIWELLDMQEIV